MSTSVRLDQDMRQKIQSASFFSKGVKNFSEALRTILGIGLHNFEQDHLLNFVNRDTKNDIRFIAQKYDLDQSLAPAGIFYLFTKIKGLVQSDSLLKQETEQRLLDVFEQIVKSRCFSNTQNTSKAFGESHIIKGREPFNVQYTYEEIEKESLAVVAKIKKIPPHHHTTEKQFYLGCIADALMRLSVPQDGCICETNTFNQILKPHLAHFIQMAKWQLAVNEKQNNVMHFESSALFFKEHQIKKNEVFSCDSMAISLFVDNSLKINAHLRLHKKGVIIFLNFYQLDELLRIAAMLSADSCVVEDNRLDGNTLGLILVKENDNLAPTLVLPKLSCFFSVEEWKQFVDLLKTIEESFAIQLSALRYQLGSC